MIKTNVCILMMRQVSNLINVIRNYDDISVLQRVRNHGTSEYIIFRILQLHNRFILKTCIGIFSAFSETECQTGFLMLENTCIQYFPDAGLRISDRSQKFCLVNGGGLAKDNIDNDKYNGGNFSDICSLKIVVRSNPPQFEI